jgi:ZIP family zinc transporter
MLFMHTLEPIWYACILSATAFLGAIAAYFIYPKKPLFIHFFSHIVAGLVVAAVAIELVPRIIDTGETIRVGLSFFSGTAAMLCARAIFSKFERFSTFSMAVASAFLLLIQGMFIAIAFYSSEKAGSVIAFSLALAAFLANFVLSRRLQEKGWYRSMQLMTLLLVAIMPPIGAWLGTHLIYSVLDIAKLEILAFGTAALLYLGAGELLEGTHGKGSYLLSIGFFLGFISLLLMD